MDKHKQITTLPYTGMGEFFTLFLYLFTHYFHLLHYVLFSIMYAKCLPDNINWSTVKWLKGLHHTGAHSGDKF